MKKFWELFEQSVITQAVITMLLIVTVCIMFLKGQVIPPLLENLTTIVVGFWIGSKIGFSQGTRKTLARVESEK